MVLYRAITITHVWHPILTSDSKVETTLRCNWDGSDVCLAPLISRCNPGTNGQTDPHLIGFRKKQRCFFFPTWQLLKMLVRVTNTGPLADLKFWGVFFLALKFRAAIYDLGYVRIYLGIAFGASQKIGGTIFTFLQSAWPLVFQQG